MIIMPYGKGSISDPFHIKSPDNLKWLMTNPFYWNNHFVQTADIDLTQNTFLYKGIIGNKQKPFTGTYDGNRHTINGYSYNNVKLSNIGLFGYVKKAVIKNLNLTNVKIIGNYNVGSLIGYAEGTNVNNCCTSGIVVGTNNVGGVVGSAQNTEMIQVTSQMEVRSGANVGLLVGASRGVLITNSTCSGHIYSQTKEMNSLFCKNIDPEDIDNSFYNYENTFLNDYKLITIGALYSDLYNDWIINNKELKIENYFNKKVVNVSDLKAKPSMVYEVANPKDLKTLLGFLKQNLIIHQTSDIDMRNEPNYHIPFFKGSFYSNGNSIMNININLPGISQLAFFKYAINSHIEVNLDSINITGYSHVSSIVYKACHSTITACNTTGVLTVSQSAHGFVFCMYFSDISYCHGEVNIILENDEHLEHCCLITPYSPWISKNSSNTGIIKAKG